MSMFEGCMAVLLALLMVLLVGLLVLLVYVLVDTVGIAPVKTVITVVEAKQIKPAHSTTTFVMAGKVMIPITTHHPESYHLSFNLEGKNFDLAVERELFDGLSIGDRIEVEYGIKRLSGSYLPITARSLNSR